MKKIIYIFVCVILVVSVLFFWRDTLCCEISDKDAIDTGKQFCQKMGIITFSQEPWVSRTDHFWRRNYDRFKEIEFGEKGDSKISLYVSCGSKDVISYNNWELRDQIRKKYKIPSVTSEPHNWPPFLLEEKAKEIILSIATKIGLPSDFEFQRFWLNKEDGIWSGHWIRKQNGFQYEIDANSMNIGVAAVDGEFISYYKSASGKPCPTDVKVNKEEAIEQGWQDIFRLFQDVDWNKHKQDYKVSAELRIVQPNTLAGQMVRQYSKESRLAWVIVYDLIKPEQADQLKLKADAVRYLYRITIKIDAATKKFLGGEHAA